MESRVLYITFKATEAKIEPMANELLLVEIESDSVEIFEKIHKELGDLEMANLCLSNPWIKGAIFAVLESKGYEITEKNKDGNNANI